MRHTQTRRFVVVGCAALVLTTLPNCGTSKRHAPADEEEKQEAGLTGTPPKPTVDGSVAKFETKPADDPSVDEVKGNGGDAIVCRDGDDAIESIELFDYFEGRILREHTPSLGDSSLQVMEKVNRALLRLARVDLETASSLGETTATFFENTRFVDVPLVDIPDQGLVIIDPTCEIEQAAIRVDDRLPNEKKFTVSQQLWDAMDGDNQAGLILHEAIYEMFGNLGHENSRAARYMNALISSEALDQLSQDEWEQIKDELLYGAGTTSYTNADGWFFHFRPTELKSIDVAKAACRRKNFELLGDIARFSHLTDAGFRTSALFRAMSGRQVFYGYYHGTYPSPRVIDVSTHQITSIGRGTPVNFVCFQR